MAAREDTLGMEEAVALLGLSMSEVEAMASAGRLRVLAWRGSGPRLSASDVEAAMGAGLRTTGQDTPIVARSSEGLSEMLSWKSRRENLGLTVAELAREADVSRLELFKVESGKREASPRLARVIPATLEAMEESRSLDINASAPDANGYKEGHLLGSTPYGGSGASSRDARFDAGNGSRASGSQRIHWSAYADEPEVERARGVRRILANTCPAEIALARYAAEGGLKDTRWASVMATVLSGYSPFEMPEMTDTPKKENREGSRSIPVAAYSCSPSYAASLVGYLSGDHGQRPASILSSPLTGTTEEHIPRRDSADASRPLIPAEITKALAVLSALGLRSVEAGEERLTNSRATTTDSGISTPPRQPRNGVR